MLGALVGFLLAGLVALATGNFAIQPLSYTTPSKSFQNTSNSLVAVPFGAINTIKFSVPSFVRRAGGSDFDANNIASDKSWNKYKAKGLYYGCLLDMSIQNAGKTMKSPGTPPSGESVWQGDLRNDLRNWGWHEASYMAEINCDFRDELGLGNTNRIETALSALGLSVLPVAAGGDNECYSIEHFDETLLEDDDADDDEYDKGIPIEEQGYHFNGVDYPSTGAFYRFGMNKKGGAIFAQNLLKPESAALEHHGEGIPVAQLPQLRRASDILWGYWVRSNPRPQNLHYYLANFIRNEETLPLIARALRNHGLAKVPYWPGLVLEMHSEDAEALLGSPIGATLAHLLIQHKATLGIKNLHSITIFRDNVPEGLFSGDMPEVQLLFRIIDVPLDEVDDDEEMEDVFGAVRKREQAVSYSWRGERDLLREYRVSVRLGAE